eukprot:355800-Lingulodinium_polyedra.AAC.1
MGQPFGSNATRAALRDNTLRARQKTWANRNALAPRAATARGAKENRASTADLGITPNGATGTR